MQIYFFDTLEAVLRTGSLAGAAAEVNVTPSAVSMQRKQLEEHFGQPSGWTPIPIPTGWRRDMSHGMRASHVPRWTCSRCTWWLRW